MITPDRKKKRSITVRVIYALGIALLKFILVIPCAVIACLLILGGELDLSYRLIWWFTRDNSDKFVTNSTRSYVRTVYPPAPKPSGRFDR